jgi:uncharacterized membrane protein YeaQ/YmgE (transglycosylase-associated protein family)
MKAISKNNKLMILGALAGAIASYFYWQFIGCNSGSCAITSTPTNSSIYGATVGALLFSMFQKKDKTTV